MTDTMAVALLEIVKSSLVLLLALSAAGMLYRHSAATRHLVLAAGIAGAAVTPAASLLVPAWEIPLYRESATAFQPPPAASPATPAPVVPAVAGAAENFGSNTDRTAGAAFLVWQAGALAALLWIVAGVLRLGSMSRRTEPVVNSRWIHAGREVSLVLGLERPIRLLRSSNISVLGTWGAFRHRVLLPGGIDDWADERLRVVLGHELAHAKRQDWLIQVIAESARAIYWFNPLFWFACRRLSRESEQAADDAVLNLGIHGNIYATHLLDLARAASTSRRVWSPVLNMARRNGIERRIVAMLNTSLNRRLPTRRAAVLAIAATLCLVVPIASVQMSAGETAAPQGGARLSGNVYDLKGVPVPAATVTVNSAKSGVRLQVRTNASGVFDFPEFIPGEYTLTVSAPGFAQFEFGSIRVEAGAVVRQSVALVPQGPNTPPPAVRGTRGGVVAPPRASNQASLSGTVADSNGVPIPGALVTAVSTTAGRTMETGAVSRADGNGNGYTYAFNSLPAGTYRVTAEMPGYRPQTYDRVDIVENGNVRLGFRLQRDSDPVPDVPPAPSARARVSQRVLESTQTVRVEPVISDAARQARIRGTVILEMVIGTDGSVRMAQVISGHVLMTPAAMEAVRQWRFQPYYLNGQPVEAVTNWTLQFDATQ